MPQQFKRNPLEQFEPEKLPIGWPWRLFSISLVIFIVALFVYLGLTAGYKPYLDSKIREKNEEISQLTQIVSRADQEKFIQFYSQLTNLKSLLDNHIAASKLFPLLERTANRKVYYRSANLKVPEQELELEGFAASYAVLGEQLESFNQAEEVARHILDQSQVSGGAVQFKITLKLKDEVFK